MDTKELRTLAEMLDILKGAIVISQADTDVPCQHHVKVSGVACDDFELANRLKPILESALESARKEVERQITKVVNAGTLTIRDPKFEELKRLHDKIWERTEKGLTNPPPLFRPYFGSTR